MEKYSSYRPSGIEWIKDIPSNWSINRLKWISEIENSGVWGVDNEFENSIQVPIPTTGQLSIEGVWLYDKMSLRFLSEKDWNKYQCREGDIVVVKSSGSSTNIITGKCGYISHYDSGKFSFSNFLLRVRPKKIHPKFLYYFLSSNLTKQRIERMASSTTYPNLKVEEYSNSIITIPPKVDQESIVDFLDEKNNLIDKLLSSKQRKIELLKEKRNSVINEIITKGLDPKVKMKNSGVKWIGNIPQHWTNTILRYYVSKVGSGLTPKGGSEVYVEEGIKFIRSQNVHFEGLRFDNISKIKLETHNSMKGSKVGHNDVLLNITGGSIGRCCVVEVHDEMNVNQHVCIIRTKKSKLSPYFLNYLLQSKIGQTQVDFFQTGGNREGLTIDNIKNFTISFPSISEQNEIVDTLNLKTKEMDELVLLEQKKIEILKEYRQSLISEVITGKIKVVE
jgi:type I restriction enzyme S subunit